MRDCRGCRLHTTDGGVQQKFGLPWVAGDVVGCGIKLDGAAHSSVDKTRIQVFFTVNGQKVGRCVCVVLTQQYMKHCSIFLRIVLFQSTVLVFFNPNSRS